MKFSIDHKSAIPLYIQAEKLLRKIIELPEHQQGKLLPNEVQMASSLGISRNTLRQISLLALGNFKSWECINIFYLWHDCHSRSVIVYQNPS